MLTLSQNAGLSGYRLGVYTQEVNVAQQLDSNLSGQSNLCACRVFMDVILHPHFG